MSRQEVVVRQLRGITFAGKSDSNHWVVMDGPEIFDGSEAGPRPKELLLIALGGCTSSNIIPILKKKRVPVDGYEVRLRGTVREEHPQIYTDIAIEYTFYGDGIDPKDVERAIELSTTKYCAISAMLKGSVRITDTYKIVESNTAPVPAEPL
jgi:putative redox protein